MTISNQARDRVKGVFEPLALALGRLGLTPDALTLIGFAITVAGAALLATQQWLLGGVVVFAGGAFDMFDGTLARATGRVSRWGAFLDSVFDRVGEAVVYLGVIGGTLAAGFEVGAILAGISMAAAFMVSYARAKSESLGFTTGSGMAAVGLMPREVRLVIISAALVVAGLTDGIVYDTTGICGFELPCDTDGSPWSFGVYVLGAALGIIAIGSTITTIQRILHVRAQANREATGRPTEQEHT